MCLPDFVTKEAIVIILSLTINVLAVFVYLYNVLIKKKFINTSLVDGRIIKTDCYKNRSVRVLQNTGDGEE
jgi:hypothetical protein